MSVINLCSIMFPLKDQEFLNSSALFFKGPLSIQQINPGAFIRQGTQKQRLSCARIKYLDLWKATSSTLFYSKDLDRNSSCDIINPRQPLSFNKCHNKATSTGSKWHSVDSWQGEPSQKETVFYSNAVALATRGSRGAAKKECELS